MRKVFFDESGNTGQNLMDEADPVFVLASCSFQAGEEQELASHFRRMPQFNLPELKFRSLRKSPAGQRAVLDFLRSTTVTSKTAAAVVFHKPHLVVTKYCDLVIEPAARKAGVDFYARGLNIATANLLTTTMPVFLNSKTWTDFLALFVQVVRERSPILFNQWRNLAELIHSHLAHAQPEMAYYIAPILLVDNADEFLMTLNDDELDPLLPAYYLLAGYWGKSLSARYELVADASKVLAKERGHLLRFSDPSLKPIRIGYDRRKLELPLQIAEIYGVDSEVTRQVQFADILGGAIASAAKARFKAPLRNDTFAREVFETCFVKGLIVDMVWPDREVDPRELGTDTEPGPEDVDAATYMGMILESHSLTTKRCP